MLRISSLVMMCFAVVVSAVAQPKPVPNLSPALVFEPNQGQSSADVKWLARGPGYELLVGDDAATIVLSGGASLPANASFGASGRESWAARASAATRTGAVRMKLKGSAPWRTLAGTEPTGGYSNYLFGKDPKGWHTHIPHYAAMQVSHVYDGIDLRLHSHEGELEYDFVVASGADPKQIRMAFDGVDRMRIDGQSGDLLLITANGSELRHHLPKIYQEAGNRRVEVAGAYEILDQGLATFALAAYDHRKPLVIDPTVTYTTFVAGSNEDFPNSITVDASGNAYITGFTASSNFPVVGAVHCTPGNVCLPEHDPKATNPPINHAFVTKLSSTGAIVYSTYLGGSGVDLGSAIAVDSTGVYVTGTTTSPDFPTHNPFKTFNASGVFDVFVTKLTLAGDSLIYSTYLGGSDFDTAYALAVDASHAAYVAGITYSCDFEPLVNPMQNLCADGHDAFVAKVNAAGNYLDYSTYLGGDGEDSAKGMAVDSTGAIYLTGYTYSTNFPIAGLVDQGSFNSQLGVAFVSKLNPQGSLLVYSLYLGFGSEVGLGIAVDPNNNAYVAGLTSEQNFPTFANAFQRTAPAALGPGGTYAFASKFAPSGSMVASTYLAGGNGSTVADAVGFDRSGDIYVAGYTSSSSFPGAPPITPNPFAGFLTKMTPQLSGLTYTTLLGAAITGITVRQSALCCVQTYPLIYTTGYRYTGGTALSNTDGFVVRLDEAPNSNSTVGAVGSFVLSPATTNVKPNDPVTYILTWTTPGVWRSLNTIELRVQDEDNHGALLWVRYEEATNSFRLMDPSTGQFGPPVTPGQPGQLDTRFATLYLDQSAVQGSGPTGHTVTLWLTASFKATGDDGNHKVQLHATDDLGHVQGWDTAGFLKVQSHGGNQEDERDR